MPIILILILLALLGGPGLVAAGLALFGVWVVGKFILALLLGCVIVLIVATVLVAHTFLRQRRMMKGRRFGTPLSDDFKSANLVEPGIWKDDMHFIVEIGGKPNYYRRLRQARLSRDTGVAH